MQQQKITYLVVKLVTKRVAKYFWSIPILNKNDNDEVIKKILT